jgi:ABC-type polysaccharide/polyol phosphate export permease
VPIALRERARTVPTELLTNLTLRELRGKFKRTALGWGWSVINPAVSLAVYATVFGVFLRVEPPTGDPSGLRSYPFFLVSGLLPWTFVANCLIATSASYVANDALVKKVYFPRAVLPASAVFAALISFGVELIVLAVAFLFVGNVVLVWVPLVLVVMALQAAFLLGLGLALAAANARFRDVSHFVTILLNVWFYATPILYPLAVVEGRQIPVLGVSVEGALQLNPMYHFVASYRDLLYDLQAPPPEQWLAMIATAAAALVVGVLVHRRIEPRLAELL